MKRMHILLVEDDEDDYLVTRRLLTTIYGEQLALEWVQTYEEALTKLSSCDYDVCLLDYRLGARNGVELLREVCAESRPLPIILMTGQGDHEVDLEAMQAGAADYLVKGQADAALLERAIRYSIQHKQSEAAHLELLREREARAQAEAANRANDAFLAIVTHELRSPLNAILGWTRILLTRPVDGETQRHALEVIEQSARTQSRLIEDILDTARVTSGKMRLEVRPVVLSEVLAAALEVVRPAAEAKGVEVQVENWGLGAGDWAQQLAAAQSPSPQPLIISGDPDRLQQIVWNLLSNAIKFTPAGGRVDVRLERADPYARIVVSDTGKGISAAFLPHIFERFAQEAAPTKGTRRRSGLGLGLALARHLVELHGGTIEAASAGAGQGATFTIDLPLRAVRPRTAPPAAHEPQATVAAAKQAKLLAGVRVLVVDDEADARGLVAAVLKHYGAAVAAAGSADEALNLLASDASFDVLVSDIGMPETSGYDLLRRVRALPPEQGGKLPAVALTAFGRSEDRIRALAAGFQTHISKPVEPAELAAVVASLTGRATPEMNA